MREYRDASEAVVDADGARARAVASRRGQAAMTERVDVEYRKCAAAGLDKKGLSDFHRWSRTEEGKQWTLCEMLMYYCANGDTERAIAAHLAGKAATKEEERKLFAAQRVDTIRSLLLMKKAVIAQKRAAGEKLSPDELTLYLRSTYVANFDEFTTTLISHPSTRDHYHNRGLAFFDSNAATFTATTLVSRAFLSLAARVHLKLPAPTYSSHPDLLDPRNTLEDGIGSDDVRARTVDGEAKTIYGVVALANNPLVKDIRDGNPFIVYDELTGIQCDESDVGRTPFPARVLRSHYERWDTDSRNIFHVAALKLTNGLFRSLEAAAAPGTIVVVAMLFMTPRDPTTGNQFKGRMYGNLEAVSKNTKVFGRRTPHLSRGDNRAKHLDEAHKVDMETLGYVEGTGQTQLDMSVLAFKNVLLAADAHAAELRADGKNVIRADVLQLYVGVAA